MNSAEERARERSVKVITEYLSLVVVPIDKGLPIEVLIKGITQEILDAENRVKESLLKLDTALHKKTA